MPRSPGDTSGVAGRNDSTMNAATNTAEKLEAGSDAWGSPEARILSILHAKNVEEIRVGRLAQERGVSDQARAYGRMLVEHHTQNDERVMEVAERMRLELVDPLRTEELLAKEMGKPARGMDPVIELRDLEGSLFDRRLGERLGEGHRELIALVEKARNEVRYSRVRALLDETLPRLREHERIASELANR